MNYWPADPAGLGACVEPLLRMVEELVRHRRTNGADDVRRSRLGGASQHRSLARGRADRRSALGPVAMRRRVAVQHAVGSLRLQPRRGDCCERLYPLMRGAALFFLDTLVEDPQGRGLVTSPSLSPENHASVRNDPVRRACDGSPDPSRPVRAHGRGRQRRSTLDAGTA